MRSQQYTLPSADPENTCVSESEKQHSTCHEDCIKHLNFMQIIVVSIEYIGRGMVGVELFLHNKLHQSTMK